ncbi:hypothetical protein WA158_001007 [Blastocystis sp. Blastoise]
MIVAAYILIGLIFILVILCIVVMTQSEEKDDYKSDDEEVHLLQKNSNTTPTDMKPVRKSKPVKPVFKETPKTEETQSLVIDMEKQDVDNLVVKVTPKPVVVPKHIQTPNSTQTSPEVTQDPTKVDPENVFYKNPDMNINDLLQDINSDEE